VLKISILPLNFPKIGVSAPNFALLDKNVPTAQDLVGGGLYCTPTTTPLVVVERAVAVFDDLRKAYTLHFLMCHLVPAVLLDYQLISGKVNLEKQTETLQSHVSKA